MASALARHQALASDCTIKDVRAVGRIADADGFDHRLGLRPLQPIFAHAAGDVIEGMTLLAATAEATSRVRIGRMVAGTRTATRLQH